MHYLLHHKFSDTSLLQIGQVPENQFTFQPIIFEGKTYFRREAWIYSLIIHLFIYPKGTKYPQPDCSRRVQYRP